MRLHEPQVHAPPRRRRKKKDRQGAEYRALLPDGRKGALARGPCAFIISRRWHHGHRFPIDLRRPIASLLIGNNYRATFSDPITAQTQTPTGRDSGGGVMRCDPARSSAGGDPLYLRRSHG
jgi:hypothetical protein